MRITSLPRVSQELLSVPFALPGGRQVTAHFAALPSVAVGPTPAISDTLQLVVEVRTSPDGEFEQVAESPVLSQYREGHATLTLPTPAKPIEPGERPPVARLRLLTTGTLQPRFEIRVEGL